MSKVFEDSVEEVSRECDDLLVQKQKDYGSQNILEFGEYGLLVRISDKFHRLKNLLQNDKEPQNETIEDTFMDLRNYAQIALMVRRGQFDLPLEEEVIKDELDKKVDAP